MQRNKWSGERRGTSRKRVARTTAVIRAAVGLLALAMCGLGGTGIEVRADSTAVLFTALTSTTAVISASGVSLPAVTGTGKGLSFKVDTSWLDQGGYRPVRITITPLRPAIADRTISVEFEIPYPWSGNDYARRIIQDVEIPAGRAAPVEVTMAIPEITSWSNQFKVRFVEDRRTIGDYAGTWRTSVSITPDCESLPGLLIVGDKAVATTALAAFLSVVDDSGQIQAVNNPAKPGQPAPPLSLPTAIVCPMADLPRRWIEYTNCDLVCLSLDELHKIGRQNPQAFQAILTWTSAGGNLLVYGVHADWSRLAELESLLKLAPKSPAAAKPAMHGWTEPAESDFGRPIQMMIQSPYRPPGAQKPPPKQLSPTKRPQSPPFLMRGYDLGMVVAIASDAPLPGDEPFWNWLLNSLGPRRWRWSQRHGLSAVQTNAEFWKFQIPGVGLPPLNGFRVLITLFVLAIGPLNYWVLRRRRQLQLLVVTIPLGAAAVTLALFGYALVADGLATRVRVRSATLLDQRRGQAACWTRLSFYSGLTPAGGLTFPADVAVIPFSYVPGDSDVRRQRMLWEDEEQRMVSGWLPARTPTQFLTLRSRATDARLDVKPPAKDGTDGGAPEVTNRLGARIAQLVVCAEDGKCYAADAVEAGGTVRLVPIATADARIALGNTLRANKPEYPQGIDPARLRNPTVRGYRARYYYGYATNSSTQPTQDTSRLESVLDALDPTRSANRSLPARSYVAIVERSPEVVLGTPVAREEASFHVILGTW